MRALSVRQPNAERILRGTKKIEYRPRATNIRERVYVYASMTPDDPDGWHKLGLKPGDLPTGVLVGTVEIVGCKHNGVEYEWRLANPRRLARKLKPKKQPQPAWFYPF